MLLEKEEKKLKQILMYSIFYYSIIKLEATLDNEEIHTYYIYTNDFF
jgi:hypothetical protein